MLIHGRLLDDPARPPQTGWIRIDGGRIVDRGDGTPPGEAIGGPDRLVCPGFIDAHMHVPQIDQIGVDGLELLDWLAEAIYPAEATWVDSDVARRQCLDAWTRLADAGTLGFAGYLTAHAGGLDAAAAASARLPLRAIVGQAVMDREAPGPLLGHPTAPLPPPTGRFAASINPRFAIACTDDLLAACGRRATETTTIQTHLAESTPECARVRELFPDLPNYVAVYDAFDLVGPRTLLAHAIHLNADEWDLIARRDAVVVHCPGANTFLRSGMFDLRAARDHGIRVALGSDVAAGPDLAMPRVARQMIEVAKLRAMHDPRAIVPTPADAWTMITRGNAEMLGWRDAGHLELGASADVLVMRLPFEVDSHLIGRLIYTWTNDYIETRIVDGALTAQN